MWMNGMALVAVIAVRVGALRRVPTFDKGLEQPRCSGARLPRRCMSMIPI
jgi:hypothetical protein